MTIDTAITRSKKILMEYWPLNSFIATNPLWKLRDKTFFDVVSQDCFNGMMDIAYYHAQYKNERISNQDLQQAINIIEKKSLTGPELKQWIDTSSNQEPTSNPRILFAEQLDEYEFQTPSTWIKERIFSTLRDYFGLKHYQTSNLMRFWYDQNNLENDYLKSLSLKPPEDSIKLIVEALKIPQEIIADYLQAIYLQIYGWSSLMNWRNAHPNNPWVPGQDPCETVLFMWLAYEYLMNTKKKVTYQQPPQDGPTKNNNDQMKIRYIWQTAFEIHYLNQLDTMLNRNFIAQDKIQDAQFIFCIDTRSEGLRRHIEAQGHYQTFGFAGFFGAIFKLHHDNAISYQAPALVEASENLNAKTEDNMPRTFLKTVKKIIIQAKKELISPFSLFEMLGVWAVFFMIFKAVQPKLGIKPKECHLKINNALPEEEKFQSAYTLLNAIGLLKNFSKWIVICAHQSDHINNPFKASLNCGACGGNSGIPNAIVMCEILNNDTIRSRLKKAGIMIPDDTQFLPACHHTTYDRLEIIDGKIPQKIQEDINTAAKNLRHEKTRALPGMSSLLEREQNWSELIPELGLINNTAIIIGPRELTLTKNLEQRVFLHSYAPHIDTHGKILSSILSAPAIVAHWINAQYYFSTVNPVLFGAGNKAIHNVLPGVGVLEGNLSDLKVGLPLQSTHFKSTPIHEPRRIIVVVYAHTKILEIAIESSPEFKTLLDNQWIHLKHIEAR